LEPASLKLEMEDGRWRIKVDRLGTGQHAKWRRISLLEEGATKRLTKMTLEKGGKIS
jgi:hypothetical protein